MPSVVLGWNNPLELEERVDAFESAWNQAGIANPADFLPPSDHPSFRAVLCELVRVDLELHWTHGLFKRVEDYLRDFPILRHDPDLLQQIAFEEYRQRLQAGESVHPAEYAERFKIKISAWPSARGVLANPREPRVDSDATLNISDDQLDRMALPPEQRAKLARMVKMQAKNREPARKVRLPRPGDNFQGFEIIEEIGRGSFGRVFKARQLNLANREVALKVALKPDEEPQQLAKLQHANIMPIFSIHRVGTLQAVCMPLLGSTTLADLIRSLRRSGSLPTSGRMLLSTLFERSRTPRPSQADSSVLQSNGSDPSASFRSGKLGAPIPAGESGSRSITHLERLANMSLVEAALSLMMRVADGLAYAHVRGILHRDLKPANILITDDGEPMLLDFNLALNVHHTPKSRARMGGTLPYMAPEQLAAFRKGERINDVRCDLYAIGLMLHELMTGTFPYKVAKGKLSEVAEVMAKDRLVAVADPRRINPAMSPAVASIVKKLLAPNPEERYQSAAELKEDLERQLSHRPLKFAQEPSLRERFGKFRRRHPRVAAAAAVGLATLALVVAPVCVLANERAKTEHRRQQIVHAESLALADRTAKDAREAQIYLQSRSQSSVLRNQGADVVRSIANRYQVFDDPNWVMRPEVQKLDFDERRQLLDTMGYTFLLMSETSKMSVPLNHGTPTPDRPEYWKQLAELCFRSTGKPARLKPDVSGVEFDKADLSKWDDADLYAQGSDLYGRGEHRQALKWLAELVRRDPQHFMGWYTKGMTHYALGQNTAAGEAWTVCISLQPYFAWPYFNRGGLQLRLGHFSEARSDFDRALELEPRLTSALVDRSFAWLGLRRLTEAEADLSQALEREDATSRLWFLRANIRRKMGKETEAKQDEAEGMKQDPSDDLSWVTRGWFRMKDDPMGALKDFDEALSLNPRCFDALTNRAHVYSEILHEDKKSLAAQDELLKRYPDYLSGRAGRGVLRARLGDVQGAKSDAQVCLALDRSAFCCYQIGSLYAQLVPHDPESKSLALELLHEALRKGFDQPTLFLTDRDLDPIRKTPEFQQLAQTALRLKFLGGQQNAGK
jgi:serine/threonine protein kinase/Tfp pilus assembly protein PilF